MVQYLGTGISLAKQPDLGDFQYSTIDILFHFFLQYLCTAFRVYFLCAPVRLVNVLFIETSFFKRYANSPGTCLLLYAFRFRRWFVTMAVIYHRCFLHSSASACAATAS